MSFEAIELIQTAEEQARKTVADAEATAKRTLADATVKVKAAQDAATAKAESEIRELKEKYAVMADETEALIMTDTAKKADELTSSSDKLIDKAAMLIAERIVNA